MTSRPVIELNHLDTGYRMKTTDKVVGHDLHATLQAGQLTCLIGPNGTGKSTLLRTIAAFQPPLGGNIYLNGKDLSHYDNRSLARLISIVLTDNTHIHDLTTREVVALGRSPYTGFWGTLTADDHRIVDQCLEALGITPLASQPIDTLSDGERQKTMIAKAIAQETPVILLDEPTAFLYYPNKVAMMLLLRNLTRQSGKTILMSIHDIDLALQVADNIWHIGEDHRLTAGTPETLCSDGFIGRHIHGEGITFEPDNRTFYIQLNN